MAYAVAVIGAALGVGDCVGVPVGGANAGAGVAVGDDVGVAVGVGDGGTGVGVAVSAMTLVVVGAAVPRASEGIPCPAAN